MGSAAGEEASGTPFVRERFSSAGRPAPASLQAELEQPWHSAVDEAQACRTTLTPAIQMC